MYANGTKSGVKFCLKPAAQVNKVAIAGDFNGWKPQSMKKQKDGSYSLTVKVPAGRHEYKFVLDGDWVHDPDVPEVSVNNFGTLNSVAEVK